LDGLGAAAGAEFVEGPAAVGFDGVLADEEAAGDEAEDEDVALHVGWLDFTAVADARAKGEGCDHKTLSRFSRDAMGDSTYFRVVGVEGP
jgi:hypothetical protein